jgi:ribonuclease HI
MNEITLVSAGRQGGWCVRLRCVDHFKEVSGGVANADGNQMELLGLVAALKCIPRPSCIKMASNSSYTRVGLLHLQSRKANGWRTKRNGPLSNVAEWKEIDQLLERHTFTVVRAGRDPACRSDCDHCAAMARAQAAILPSHTPLIRPDTHKPTPAEIEAAKSPAGGWTRKQLAGWGVPWPPPKGWRRALESKSHIKQDPPPLSAQRAPSAPQA